MRYLASDTAKRISKIGLGTWQFGSREWGYGDAYAQREAHAITRRALELGVTLFDTAEIYGFGRSERILGEALGEDAASVFVATKILPVLPVAPVVEQRAVASANRLGVRRLDLYQVHQPNPVIRDGTIMRGMRALQRVGLVGDAGDEPELRVVGGRLLDVGHAHDDVGQPVQRHRYSSAAATKRCRISPRPSMWVVSTSPSAR